MCSQLPLPLHFTSACSTSIMTDSVDSITEMLAECDIGETEAASRARSTLWQDVLKELTSGDLTFEQLSRTRINKLFRDENECLHCHTKFHSRTLLRDHLRHNRKHQIAPVVRQIMIKEAQDALKELKEAISTQKSRAEITHYAKKFCTAGYKVAQLRRIT